MANMACDEGVRTMSDWMLDGRGQTKVSDPKLSVKSLKFTERVEAVPASPRLAAGLLVSAPALMSAPGPHTINSHSAKAADDHLTDGDIIEMLQRELGLDTSGIDRSTPLFSAGLIDSFSLVSLLLFLETRSGITIEPMDVTLANFDSIDRMLAYVASAKGTGLSAGG